ncbi:M16 family metallopeptidase [Alteromonas halophila]|uniref:Peptidase M16 n=1 Tax=Alteromonas halophila TaxID=516698 RepID=A0A918MZI1_9ALTE|nr:pitrilysin family protein [Alteromonas halophila]GGW89832.1 peptidase M16 [Alteromonas halophila]
MRGSFNTRVKGGLFAALLFTLSAPGVATAASFPSTPPKPAQAKNFTLPDTQTFQLDNGLSVTFIPYGSTPKTTLVLQFATGNADDGETPHISDLTFELLSQGTKAASAGELARRASSMGGQIETSVSMNSSYLSMDVLSEFAQPAAQLMAELVTTSTFPKASLERAVANHWREIQVSQSRPQGQSMQAFYTHMYPDHPYGVVYPTQSALQKITQEDIIKFARSQLVAGNAHLYVAGRFDANALKSKIEDDFSVMIAGDTDKNTLPMPAVPVPALLKVERPGAVQTTVRLGQRTIPMSDEDYIPLQVTNTLLGGMFSSRITQNIREDKGYTYSPRSSLYSYKGVSVWFEAADIDAPSTGEALNEIISEIRGVQQTPPPAWELDGVKNYMSGLFVLRNSSRTGLISQLISLDVNGLPRSRLTNYISMVNDVDAASVSKVASDYLDLSTMSLVVVGDPALLEEELKQVNALPVVTKEDE